MKKIILSKKQKIFTILIIALILSVALSFAIMGIVYSCRGNIDDNLPNSYLTSLKQDAFINEADVRIMTSNLLVSYKSWGGVPVKPRAKRYVSMIKEYMPDVIGFQEMDECWLAALTQNLPKGYRLLYGLETATQFRLTAMMYNENTLTLKEHGTFKIKDGENQRLRRIVWARFVDKKSNKSFIVTNTHFSLLFAGKEQQFTKVMREQAKEQIAFSNEMTKKYNCPVISVGDFNSMEKAINSDNDIPEIYNTLSNSLVDAKYSATNKIFGEALKYDGTKTKYDDPTYDHIFYNGNCTVNAFGMLTYDYLTELSDHYPLIADFNL